LDVSRQDIEGKQGIFYALFPVDDPTREAGLLVLESGSKILDLKKNTFIVFAAFVFLSACQRPAPNAAIQPTQQVTDDLGRVVTVPVKITRVVSTAPSVTENVFAVGAGDRLIGVTTFCNYPEEAKSIAKIGDTLNPNIETIVALKPDVVLVSSASQLENFAQVLADNSIAVYVTDPATLDDVFKNIKRLGDLFGTQERVEQMLPDLKRRVGEIWAKVRDERKVRVFVQISREPLFTIGKDSFLNNVIIKAGGESVTADVASAYPKLNPEAAMAMMPDAIIISESPDNRSPNDAFRNSPAVRNGRIYKVNADLVARPGPRLVDAMEQIAKDLHPEKFRNN
jgi:iron complex transport system substrate-binding protein